MLIKVSLIVAILAAIGSLVVSQFQVAETIKDLKTDLDSTRSDLTKTKEDETKARADAKAAKAEAEKASKELTETSANLETATARVATLDARAKKAEADLETTSAALTAVRAELASWNALGYPVNLIERRFEQYKDATNTIAALSKTTNNLVREIRELRLELGKYREEKDVLPPMPANLRGKVLAVDPKWDFVILDIGLKQGVVERGVLLVNRDGRLVAKLRVTKAEEDRCFANVMPGRLGDILEGDQVLP